MLSTEKSFPRTTLRMGVIGGGLAVQKALPALLELNPAAILCGENELVGLIDSHLRVASLESFLSNTAVDAVYLATPVATHMPIAKLLLQRGLPVLVEKPLALSINEVLRLELDLRKNLSVAFKKRFSSAVNEISRVSRCRQGASHMTFKWYTQYPGPDHWKRTRETAGGGVLMDLGSHVFDLLEHVLGRIATVKVTQVTFNPETGIDEKLEVVVEFEKGSTGCIDLAWTNDAESQELTIQQGTQCLEWKRQLRGPDMVTITSERSKSEMSCDPIEEYRGLFSSFYRTALGRHSRTPTFCDGLRNLYVIHCVYQSASQSKQIAVFNPTPTSGIPPS